MEPFTSDNSKSLTHQLRLAKLLLRNYGILHEFHVRQIECYLVACCQTALDGVSEIDANNKTVTYTIYTSRFFNKTPNKDVVSKNKWLVKVLSIFGKKKYEQEKVIAALNLNTWSRELLWGDDTKVRIVIDGQSVQ